MRGQQFLIAGCNYREGKDSGGLPKCQWRDVVVVPVVR